MTEVDPSGLKYIYCRACLACESGIGYRFAQFFFFFLRNGEDLYIGSEIGYEIIMYETFWTEIWAVHNFAGGVWRDKMSAHMMWGFIFSIIWFQGLVNVPKTLHMNG